MKAIVHEVRILIAEWLLHCSLRLMPGDARECEPLEKALDGYVTETNRINRWEKFPA